MRAMLLLLVVGGGQAVLSPGLRDYLSSAYNDMENGFDRLGSDVRHGYQQMSSEFDQQFGDLSQRVGHQLGSWEASLGQEVDDLAANIGSGLDTMTDMVQDQTDQISAVLGDAYHRVDTEVMEGFSNLGRSPFFSSFPRMNPNMFGGFTPNNFLDVFRPRRPNWWEGDNVCVDREVTDDPIEGLDVQSNSPHLHVQMRRCFEGEGVFECSQSIIESGITKTVKTIFSCCHGYKLTSGVCQEFDMRPTEETIAALDGTEFLTLLSEDNLLSAVNNATVFLPDDTAVNHFKQEMEALKQGGGLDGGVVYNVDDGLLYRRKRSLGIVVDEEPAVTDLLLGHISPNINNVKDFENNEMIKTKAGSSIRMSVYNTQPMKVVLANCALITSKDHHTTTGVVHVIDKVLQPTTQTIGEILSADLQFRTFMSALDASDAKMLDAENETLTVFAPTEKAFKELDAVQREKVMGGGSCSHHVLHGHILHTVVCSGAVTGRAEVHTSTGSLMELRRDADGHVYADGIKLIIKDMMAINGVIHVIDSVIIPQSANTVEEELKLRQADKFLGLLEKSKLKEKLNSLDNFTLLLPHEEALDQDTLSALESADAEQLEKIVLHHVVPKQTSCSSVSGELQALSGKAHHVHNFGLRPTATISCARFVTESKQVCGGNVQAIDRLLLPPVTDLLDTLRTSSHHQKFYQLLQASHISEELDYPHSIFAPTDSAFQKLPAETLHKIFGDKAMAKKLVRSHIIPKIVCCSHAPNIIYFTRGERTLEGHSVHLARGYGGKVLVNKHAIERCDVVAENGILHSLEHVLLPRELQENNRRQSNYFWSF